MVVEEAQFTAHKNARGDTVSVFRVDLRGVEFQRKWHRYLAIPESKLVFGQRVGRGIGKGNLLQLHLNYGRGRQGHAHQIGNRAADGARVRFAAHRSVEHAVLDQHLAVPVRGIFLQKTSRAAAPPHDFSIGEAVAVGPNRLAHQVNVIQVADLRGVVMQEYGDFRTALAVVVEAIPFDRRANAVGLLRRKNRAGREVPQENAGKYDRQIPSVLQRTRLHGSLTLPESSAMQKRSGSGEPVFRTANSWIMSA